jgi:hypothetical protein
MADLQISIHGSQANSHRRPAGECRVGVANGGAALGGRQYEE